MFAWSTPPEASGLQLVTQERITTAQLLATYPANADNRGKYCRVSDMWGTVDGVYRCSFNGRIFFWEPTTVPRMFNSMPVTGNTTIQPLNTPPLLELTGTLPALTTWTVTLGTDNLPPGIERQLRPSLSSLLGTLNIVGLGLAATVNMVLGTTPRFVSWDNGSAVVWRRLD